MLPNATPEEIQRGAGQICKTVGGNQPFFIGRNGTVELEAFFYWVAYRRGPGAKPYPIRVTSQMATNAGVWPATDESLDAWASAYATALGRLDGLAAGWYAPWRNVESALLEQFAPDAFRTPLRSLEPYYSEPDLRWTQHLAGKTVAVVNSFTESIERQIAAGLERVWPSNRMLPTTINWRTVRTYYSPSVASDGIAGWPPAIRNWREAINWTVQRVKDTGATVALIGCGGIGMIIASELRAAGISTFVMGGATQVLFGIKGQRWATHSIISGFWNDAWTWPSRTETPSRATAVEGACYWEQQQPEAPKIDEECDENPINTAS